MWVDGDQDPRTYGEPDGELATYREYLTNYRLTLGMKCEGLGPEELARRSVPPSAMSLLGLVRHMARVEHFWFHRVRRGTTGARLYDDGDAGFAEVEPTEKARAEAWATWQAEVASADDWLDGEDDAALGEVVTFRDGTETATKRDILVHLIEEYARHCGHADLLREAIDGRRGQ
ncbi:DinB family protein [Nocardioides sp. GY 10113]|uniref:DinB family protein n=1 Tax=Nocardioides sp. GY 10113 TaxID=2569761 RepID=UPI0010A8B1DD|nr:DinB family protein [Nocardioides sp. GY 10113]TIC87562.1 DinB family protein [Nocardioides sp. GY 10113]